MSVRARQPLSNVDLNVHSAVHQGKPAVDAQPLAKTAESYDEEALSKLAASSLAPLNAPSRDILLHAAKKIAQLQESLLKHETEKKLLYTSIKETNEQFEELKCQYSDMIYMNLINELKLVS